MKFTPNYLRTSIVWALALLPLASACAPAPTRPTQFVFRRGPAADLTPIAAAAVRLRVERSGNSVLRSGVIVDPRGYVLTSFSAVGVSGVSGRARPGTLYSGGELISVEIFDGPFSPTPTRYVARVVRGDLQLDLALLRIVEGDEGPLDPEHRFSAASLESEAEAIWGSSGWAIGAIQRIPGIAAAPIDLLGATINADGEISGYLTYSRDALQGLLGGPAIDSRGDLLGINLGSFIRPLGRVPETWRRELAAGHIEDRRVEGIRSLVPGQWVQAPPIGDSVLRWQRRQQQELTEAFVFDVPAGQAGTITVDPPVGVAAYRHGQRLESGTGEIFVGADPGVYVVVRLPRTEDPRGIRLRVRLTPQ